MKLYYSPGARSLAVHIALREAERRFEMERVDHRAQRTAAGADYVAINAKGYVPALALDEGSSELLTEVPAILQYVADLVPFLGLAPPSGTFARYHLQEWLSFILAEIDKEFELLFEPDTPAPTQERARTSITARLAYCAGTLRRHPYLLGDTFTVADCYLFVMLRWCERFDIDLHTWRALEEYFDRILQRPAVQSALVAEGLVETRHHRRSA